MRIFGVTGWKNAGKTGLMERLVTEITSRGFTVSTLKHAHHSFDVDHPGKDSHRHRVAGASQVLLASRTRWALMTELRDAPEPPLAELLAQLAPVDLILVEGYKRDTHPKVEAFRAATGNPLWAADRDDISWASPVLCRTASGRDAVITHGDPETAAWDPETGVKRWAVDLVGGDVAPSPVCVDGRVYTVYAGYGIFAVDADSGSRIWSVASLEQAGFAEAQSLATDGARLYQSTLEVIPA